VIVLTSVPGDEEAVLRPLLWTTDDDFDKAPPNSAKKVDPT
jgi:hypothetical protein